DRTDAVTGGQDDVVSAGGKGEIAVLVHAPGGRGEIPQLVGGEAIGGAEFVILVAGEPQQGTVCHVDGDLAVDDTRAESRHRMPHRPLPDGRENVVVPAV